jgi:penicillin-binding protein 1A
MPSRRSSKKKPSLFHWTWSHVHLSIFVLSISSVLTLFIGVLLYLFLTLNIPAISSIESYQPPATTVILASDNTIIDRIFTENRHVIELKQMPDLLPKAFIAAEDARFFQHGGVDAWSITRALIHNIRKGGRGQGGSTITQQVARGLLLSPEKTYTRKVKEAILAYRIDKVLTKKEILYIYLNQIYLGEGAYGVEAASRTYFGKHCSDLNLSEISILAGLPKAPSRYSPFKHYDLTKKRQAYVLNRMAEEGYITPTMARKAYQKALLWGGPPEFHPESKYFTQYIRNYITRKYGKKMLRSGGLKIHTTLDLDLQQLATAAISKGAARWAVRRTSKNKKLPQAALVAIENSTGKVRALVGGIDFNRSQFNRATQAKRQPGSAFKPIIFTTAFDNGYTPASIIEDSPLLLPGAANGSRWKPRNFNGQYYGDTTLQTGLIHSRNIVAIKLLQQLGIPAVIEQAKKMGISSPLRRDLSLALGSSEVSLLELTASYTAFPNLGNVVQPLFITQIKDRNNKILEKNSTISHKVLSPEAAYQTNNILQKVIQEGTGRRAWGLDEASAGKTGTTDSYMDAWFIGYTQEMVTGVWLGFDRNLSLGNNETGGKACAPIWLDFMKSRRLPPGKKEFPVPDGIVFIPIDENTGQYDPTNRDRSKWTPFDKKKLPWKELSFQKEN